jgi:hypothetical protein
MLTCKCEGYTYITYENYCLCVDEVIAEQKKLNPTDKNKFKNMLTFLNLFKQKVTLHLKMIGISIKDLITGMLKLEFFNILKMLKFDFTQLIKGILGIQNLVKRGILKIIAKIATIETIQKFRRKLIKIDDFLKEYPILKYLAGPALAGLLFWMWLNISFIGDVDTDFNFQYIFDAFIGKYSLYDLFGSEDGLLMIGSFFTGILGIVSFDWMIATPIVIPLAILYTVLKNAPLKNKIKSWAKRVAPKVNPSNYQYQPVPKYDVKKTLK